MDHGIEPITDDELLYRRVPVSMKWYANGHLSPEAFGPRKNDTTGISVYRAKHKSIEEAAKGKSKDGYYVAVLCAGDLRRVGISVLPRPELPDGFDPAHAEVPELNFGDRKADKTLECKRLLADKLCLRVEGPFLTNGDESA